jgi:hypothetical protein
MELMHNQAFRLLEECGNGAYPVGIYRVIFDEAAINKTVCVCIQGLESVRTNQGGRRRLEKTKMPRKKALSKLIGELLWMNRDELVQRDHAGTLKRIEIEREAIYFPSLEPIKDRETYERRCSAMANFLDFNKLKEEILLHGGLGGLVREAIATTGVSRSYVYKQWSTLCRLGISEISLLPRRDRCGAPFVRRPCDPGGRKKAGRKTVRQRLETVDRVVPAPEQPGMSSEWYAAIIAADKRIKTPVKPRMAKRYNLILESEFVKHYRQVGEKLEPILPNRGEYPNLQQVRRVLEHDVPRMQRLLEKTTKGHFNRSLRGLVARNWQGVAGPGHTWAIDSSLADIYLRSSINRAWIVGRPIVYIIVDIWSTAIVGFYVCLTGPSWKTAKISLFNAAADPLLIGDLWGYQPILSLVPYPTLCYQLLCDRGEYLSKGASLTAMKMALDLAYTPPYRPDLKGLVEVLHRIAKDEQYLFAPGAMDARRAEFDLRKSHPAESAMTVRAYVQYLHEIFGRYNLTADRSKRLDAHMVAAGVFPSPAGLWRWGHEMGVGFGRAIPEADLITTLLEPDKARVGKSSVVFAGNDYLCNIEGSAHWTTIARNHGGWDLPIHRYPGTVGRIWTPNTNGHGLLDLRISDQANASAEATFDELADVLMFKSAQRADISHSRTLQNLQSLHNTTELIKNERRLTEEAVARDSGTRPSMSEARTMEVAVGNGDSGSESKAKEMLRDDAMQAYEEMMHNILHSGDQGDENHG